MSIKLYANPAPYETRIKKRTKINGELFPPLFKVTGFKFVSLKERTARSGHSRKEGKFNYRSFSFLEQNYS
jgi:hypothetical protein